MNLRSRHCACSPFLSPIWHLLSLLKERLLIYSRFYCCAFPRGVKNEGTIPDILIWHSHLLNPSSITEKTTIPVGYPFEGKNIMRLRKYLIWSCHRIITSLCFIHSFIHLFISIYRICMQKRLFLHGSLLKQLYKLKNLARLFCWKISLIVGLVDNKNWFS